METYRSTVPAGRDGFDRLLRAEWVKLWSVPRWVLGLLAAVVLTIMIALLAAAGSGSESSSAEGDGGGGGGGGGGGVADYRDEGFFLHKPMSGDGSIVARVTSQRDSHESAKAGVMIRKSTEPGSSYAAVMVTPRHGVRLQADYKTDEGGGSVTAPRWLKLTRSGGSVTGYESADGVTWRKVGTVEPGALGPAAEAGMFVASPNATKITRRFGGESIDESGTVGQATFDSVRIEAAGTQRPGPWRQRNKALVSGEGGSTESGGTFTLRGSGDVARVEMNDDLTQNSLAGVLIGLMAIVALAVLFMTSEYKRGMIRTTFTVSPRRGRVLAAKAIVIGAATFAAALVATMAAFLITQPLLRAKGFEPPLFDQPSLSEGPVLRAVVGSAVLLAVIAVFALGVAAILRHSAAAITVVLLLLVVPQVVATGLPVSAAKWLQRATPSAGFAIQQTKERYDTPIGPWAGLGVLTAYTAVTLAVALWLLRRRDA